MGYLTVGAGRRVFISYQDFLIGLSPDLPLRAFYLTLTALGDPGPVEMIPSSVRENSKTALCAEGSCANTRVLTDEIINSISTGPTL